MEIFDPHEYAKISLKHQTREFFNVISHEHLNQLDKVLRRALVFSNSSITEDFIPYETLNDIVELSDEDTLINSLHVNNSSIIHLVCSPHQIKQGLVEAQTFELIEDKCNDGSLFLLRHKQTSAVISVSGEQYNGLWSKVKNSPYGTYELEDSNLTVVGKVSIVDCVNEKTMLLSLIRDVFEVGKLRGIRAKMCFSLIEGKKLNAIYYPPISFENFEMGGNFRCLFLENSWKTNEYCCGRFEREYPELASFLRNELGKIKAAEGDGWESVRKELYEAYLIMRGYGATDIALCS